MSSSFPDLSHGPQRPARIVLHSTESDAGPDTYAAGWVKAGMLGAQIVVGQDGSITRYVPDNRVAYGTGGNNTGTLDIEMVGHARWSRDEWEQHPAQLQAVAAVIAGWSKAYGIPIAVDPSTRGGISTHAMNSAIYPDSDKHWDPGPGFPLQLVVAQAAVFADQGKGVVPPQTVGQTTPVTEIPNYRPGSAPPVSELPNATPAAGVGATPLAIIRDYAPKVGLDPAAVIAYALTQGGTSWGAAGDPGYIVNGVYHYDPHGPATSFGPFQMHVTGAAGNRSLADAATWANSAEGLIAGMNMMAHAGASGLTGPAAAAYIVGPHFGRGTDTARDEAAARAMYPRATALLKQYPGGGTSTVPAVSPVSPVSPTSPVSPASSSDPGVTTLAGAATPVPVVPPPPPNLPPTTPAPPPPPVNLGPDRGPPPTAASQPAPYYHGKLPSPKQVADGVIVSGKAPPVPAAAARGPFRH